MHPTWHKDPQGAIPAVAGTQCRRCFYAVSFWRRVEQSWGAPLSSVIFNWTWGELAWRNMGEKLHTAWAQSRSTNPANSWCPSHKKNSGAEMDIDTPWHPFSGGFCDLLRLCRKQLHFGLRGWLLMQFRKSHGAEAVASCLRNSWYIRSAQPWTESVAQNGPSIFFVQMLDAASCWHCCEWCRCSRLGWNVQTWSGNSKPFTFYPNVTLQDTGSE